MTRPLRILYAIPENYPNHRPDVGVLFGTSLPAAGVRVDLLATVDGDAVGEAPPWVGGSALLHRAHGRLGLTLADLWQQLTLFHLTRKGYDALVVRDKPVLGLLGFLAAKLASVPFVYWMSYPLPEHYLWLAAQGDGRVGAPRRLWLRLRGMLGRAVLSKVLVPGSDWLFVQSDAMEAFLRRGPLRHNRVTPVPMGVDVDALPPPAATLPEPLRQGPFGVYLGTLDRSRQPEVLVETALKVVERVPGFRMLIVGGVEAPSDRGWLQRYAESRRAGHCVHFTGRLPSHEALALARRADVGLSPVPRTPLTEVGSPTKAVEYLACGLPVVCNDQPDQAYVVTQSGGGRVTGFDADEFADAIVATLEEGPSARVRSGEARAWVERHRSYRVLGQLVADTLVAMVTERSQRRADRMGTEP
jgi:glycosyltransferase involved in cell wall biosynthesis